MRLGIVSDIHCNYAGFAAALEAMGDIDELLCLGDSIFQDEFSNEVVSMLRDRGARIIHGNHEEASSPLLAPPPGPTNASTPTCLRSLPASQLSGP